MSLHYVNGIPAAAFEAELSQILALSCAPTGADKEISIPTEHSLSHSQVSLASSLSPQKFLSPEAAAAAAASPDSSISSTGGTILVAVLQRCGLSQAVYNTWASNSELKKLNIELVTDVGAGSSKAKTSLGRSTSTVLQNAKVLVAHENVKGGANLAALLAFGGWKEVPEPEDFPIVTRHWIHDMILGKAWLPPAHYRHYLQSEQRARDIEAEAEAEAAAAASAATAAQHKATAPPSAGKRGRGSGGEYVPKASAFACQADPEKPKPNKNKELADMFDKLVAQFENKAKDAKSTDQFRHKHYRQVARRLRELDVELTEANFRLHLRNIKDLNGKTTLEKIEQFFLIGTCNKLKAAAEDPTQRVLVEFCKIWGVGPRTASDLFYQYSCRSIDDIRAGVANCTLSLSARQQVGLKYIDEFQQRIPRAEIDQIFNHVLLVAKRINPGVSLFLCGSYRRGKPSSGDMDILVQYPLDPSSSSSSSSSSSKGPAAGAEGNAAIALDRLQAGGGGGGDIGGGKDVSQTSENSLFSDERSLHSVHEEQIQRFLFTLTDTLMREGIVTDHLAGHRDDRDVPFGFGGNKDSTRASYMGVCHLPGAPHALHRRIDIKVYPPDQLPFALLYFTGSDLFNRSMRLYAKKIRNKEAPIGYTLSDKGLFPKSHHTRKGECVNGPAIQGLLTERAVLEYLGLAWREPRDRTGGAVESDAAAQEDHAPPPPQQQQQQQQEEDEEEEDDVSVDEGERVDSEDEA